MKSGIIIPEPLLKSLSRRHRARERGFALAKEMLAWARTELAGALSHPALQTLRRDPRNSVKRSHCHSFVRAGPVRALLEPALTEPVLFSSAGAPTRRNCVWVFVRRSHRNCPSSTTRTCTPVQLTIFNHSVTLHSCCGAFRNTENVAQAALRRERSFNARV